MPLYAAADAEITPYYFLTLPLPAATPAITPYAIAADTPHADCSRYAEFIFAAIDFRHAMPSSL